MKKSALLSSEEKTSPILIVDKKGLLGIAIAEEISKEVLTVFVSGINTAPLSSSNVINVNYAKKFPSVPDNIYSHIILIDNGDEGIKESLPVFIKRASRDNSSITYVTSLSDNSLRAVEKIHSLNKKIKAIIYGDVFGNGNGMLFENSVDSIIKQAKFDKKIRIPGDGLNESYPVLFEDVLAGVLKGMLSSDNSKVFFLFPKHPISLIFLAHMLQKKDPQLAVDFIKARDEPMDIKINIEGKYLLEEPYDVSAKLATLDLSVNDDKSPQEKRIDGKSKFPKIKVNFFYPLLFFAFLVFLPWIILLIFSLLGLFQVNSVKANIEKGNFKSASENFKKGEYLLTLALSSGRLAESEAAVFGQKENISNVLAILSDYKKLLNGGRKGTDFINGIKNVVDGKTIFADQAILSSSASLRESLALIQEVRMAGRINKNILAKLDEYNSFFNIANGERDTLYSLLNPKGARKYLVLFQNNMELRPGGGFIGSYGILSFDKGKFVDFTVHDVYDADGQLKGHVEPPFPIRRYIPLVHWYLRDSNFNVDFTKSASTAAFFLSKETGEKVDGVIGVDVSFVRELIGAVGEVNVPEYNEKINSSNFFIVTESHVEKNFFPASTQKKDFLNALFVALKNKLALGKNLPYDKIAQAISKAIYEKHIVLAFADASLQSVASSNNWTSNIKETPSTKGVEDFVGISEANLGVNKANYFVSRSIKHDVIIAGDGSVTGKTSLVLKNDSDKWPGGDYKVYLRFITPLNSNLLSIGIDGKNQKLEDAVIDPLKYEAKNFRPPSGLEIEKYNQSKKTIFGFLTIVPAGKSKKITLTYQLAKKYPLSSQSSNYSLDIFKQPGTENYSFNFSLQYPNSLKAATNYPGALLQDGRIAISKILKSDDTISLSLFRN